MRQKTIITSKIEMLVVDLPEGIYQIICNDDYVVMPIKGMHAVEIKGNWQDLGKATELTE